MARDGEKRTSGIQVFKRAVCQQHEAQRPGKGGGVGGQPKGGVALCRRSGGLPCLEGTSTVIKRFSGLIAVWPVLSP